ncbi:MAG TPA: PA4642 family protein [Pseudomonadales bacterium]|nr:PA4642 family protein [Pseudomonadales bacterium]
MTEMEKPAQQKKDKKAVEDELRTDEQLRFFLGVQPPAGVDADYHALEIAYRNMKPDEFARFISFFKADSRNVQARNPAGETIADVLKQHRLGASYLAVM